MKVNCLDLFPDDRVRVRITREGNTNPYWGFDDYPPYDSGDFFVNVGERVYKVVPRGGDYYVDAGTYGYSFDWDKAIDVTSNTNDNVYVLSCE